MVVEEVAVGCAAGECFNTQNTRASKQVEATRSGDLGREPIEECFPYPVPGGPQARVLGEWNFSATPFPADDS
jgi:hypothetical protein